SRCRRHARAGHGSIVRAVSEPAAAGTAGHDGDDTVLGCPVRQRRGTLDAIHLTIAALLVCMASAAAAQNLPKVRVVATGGTIAAEQREPGTLGGYDIKKSVNEIVALVPNVQRFAQVETEQFSNVPSPSITPDHWLRLAQRINAIFKERPDLAGIVVTHGTARLEE